MNQTEAKFVETVWHYYKTNGRHTLPWRQTNDPYAILVSELMLQQTQVSRVVPKYEAFLHQYPTVTDLASASLGEVLTLWQGLGYNRRAKYLHQTAKQVVNELDGVFPTRYDRLLVLPGIGPYTAAAVCVYAYNQPVPLIETNVRQVYIHHFFKRQAAVTDGAILQKVAKTLPPDYARQWYSALMDYGTYLKSEYGNNTRVRNGYRPQGAFQGSDRQVRGAIVRSLTQSSKSTATLLKDLADFPSDKITAQLQRLVDESLVLQQAEQWRLP